MAVSNLRKKQGSHRIFYPQPTCNIPQSLSMIDARFFHSWGKIIKYQPVWTHSLMKFWNMFSLNKMLVMAKHEIMAFK